MGIINGQNSAAKTGHYDWGINAFFLYDVTRGTLKRCNAILKCLSTQDCLFLKVRFLPAGIYIQGGGDGASRSQFSNVSGDDCLYAAHFSIPSTLLLDFEKTNYTSTL